MQHKCVTYATHSLKQPRVNKLELITSVLNEWNTFVELFVLSWACWVLMYTRYRVSTCSIVIGSRGNIQTEHGNMKLIFGHHGICTCCILCSVWPPVCLVLSFVNKHLVVSSSQFWWVCGESLSRIVLYMTVKLQKSQQEVRVLKSISNIYEGRGRVCLQK